MEYWRSDGWLAIAAAARLPCCPTLEDVEDDGVPKIRDEYDGNQVESIKIVYRPKPKEDKGIKFVNNKKAGSQLKDKLK